MAEIFRFEEYRTAIPSDILSMLRSLKNELVLIEDIASVVLFGSYSKGTYGKDSDIDIAVFVADTAVSKIHAVYRKAVHCVTKYPYDVQILIFPVSTLDSPIGIVEEIVAYGQDITFI